MLKTLRPRFQIQHEAHHEGAPILEVTGLTVRYGPRVALEDISFQLTVGERVAVVGPNGAGKSTLFQVVAGVLSGAAGQVQVYGTRPKSHTCIAYVPQRSQVDWAFPVSVADVVMMGRIGQIGLFRNPRTADWQYVRECLALVGMDAFARRHISELSGGQQQRVFIARALAQQAELILMDEPFSGLDLPSQEGILDLLDELRARGVTVMIATHDLTLAETYFDRIMLLNRRILGFGLPGEVITPARLISAYGGHLHMIPSADGLVMLGDDGCCDGGALST